MENLQNIKYFSHRIDCGVKLDSRILSFATEPIQTAILILNGWVSYYLQKKKLLKRFIYIAYGVSSNPCASNYGGPEAFSEPESRHLRDFVTEHSDKIKMYIAFHSYGQFLVFPFSYTEEPVDNYDILVSYKYFLFNFNKLENCN